MTQTKERPILFSTPMVRADLAGPALDWAVAQAEGLPVDIYRGGSYGKPDSLWYVANASGHKYSPSTDWAQGGLLIEKYGIDLEQYLKGRWRAETESEHSGLGDTPLIAACRAIVAAKLGDTVQVPKELICVY